MKWWKNLIERIAESNRKEYGSKRLDCCDLNRQK
ncbi:LDCC motif putative metal-binding protein [Proteiniclasticum sp. C24MP]